MRDLQFIVRTGNFGQRHTGRRIKLSVRSAFVRLSASERLRLHHDPPRPGFDRLRSNVLK